MRSGSRGNVEYGMLAQGCPATGIRKGGGGSDYLPMYRYIVHSMYVRTCLPTLCEVSVRVDGGEFEYLPVPAQADKEKGTCLSGKASSADVRVYMVVHSGPC